MPRRASCLNVSTVVTSQGSSSRGRPFHYNRLNFTCSERSEHLIAQPPSVPRPPDNYPALVQRIEGLYISSHATPTVWLTTCVLFVVLGERYYCSGSWIWGIRSWCSGMIICMSRGPVSPWADHFLTSLFLCHAIQEHVYTTGTPPTTIHSEITLSSHQHTNRWEGSTETRDR